jgi:hypothetical protein
MNLARVLKEREVTTRMKISAVGILCLAASVLFPYVAGAKLSMTPQALGVIESKLDYCAQVDPDSAAKYKEREKAFVGDATKEELEKARDTSEYKQSYDSTTDDLNKTPKKEVVKACNDFLEGK